MEKTTWTRKEVSRITGIPDRRVLFYTEQPFLLPFVKKETGRGTAREYNVKDIFCLLLVKELDSLGLSLTRIRLILHTIWMADSSDIDEFPIRQPGALPKLNLWPGGKFTDVPIIMLITPDHKKPESVGLGFVTGDREVTIKADNSSQIIVNLNLIFKEAKW